MANFNRDNRSGGGRERRFGGGNSGGRNFGNKSFGGGNRDFGRPAMHQAICDNCGKNCQVPFKPTGDKPVYCSNCFENMGNTRENTSENRRFDRPSFDRPNYEDREMFSAICDNCGNEAKLPFKPSSDKPVYCSNCFSKQKETGFGRSGRGDDNRANSELKDQLVSMNAKLDRLLSVLDPRAKKEKAPTVTMEQITKQIEEAKPEKVKKAAPKKASSKKPAGKKASVKKTAKKKVK